MRFKEIFIFPPKSIIQGDSLARGPKLLSIKYFRIWRNVFKCTWM